jgi:hypothetical protein
LKYYVYTLSLLKPLNRFQNLGTRKGVIVKSGERYADYHPWTEFGDLSIDAFLDQISNKNTPKWFERQLNNSIRPFELKSFKNHGPESEVRKLKILNAKDLDSIEFSSQKLRLDPNGGLKKYELSNWWNSLSSKQRKMVEYIEDPCDAKEQAWMELSELGIPLAGDRIKDLSHLCQFLIFKPNIEDMPVFPKIIFSSYMGHDLGRILSYYDLIDRGDLSLVHGIDTPELFDEQTKLFESQDLVRIPQKENFAQVFRDLERLNWKHL